MADKPTISPEQFYVSLDTLGELRQKIKKLKEEEEELSKILKPQMEDGQVITTTRFRIELIVRHNRVLNQLKVRARLGQKKFLEIAKVGVEELKKVMGAEDIDACTDDFKVTRSISCDPIE